ncbi:MAG: DUF2157 domain-containing protein [Candidatus Melainabacteria bacterium]|nr:DUF2157 domain-containing protein [Candidatus Melainabacteria bacterium]
MQQLTSTANTPTLIMRPRYDFLKNEIARWQEENILNRVQGDEILARYSVEGGPRHGLLALLITGACVVAGSLILFISSNWPGVTIQIKGIAVVCAMVACYSAAWRMRSKSPLKTILSEALVFLGSVLFGGATVLISQHFQVTGNQPELLVWAMGIAPFIILFRSHASAILCAGVVAYAALRPWGEAYPADMFAALCSLGAIYCAYITRSQVALAVSLFAFGFGLCRTPSNVAMYLFVFFGIGSFIMHLWHEHSKRWQIMSTPYLLVSFLFVLVQLLMPFGEYSARGYFDADSIQRVQIAALATLALLATLIKSPAGKTRWPLMTGALIICTLVFSCFSFSDEHRLGATMGAFFFANLFYLFYITSSIENRLIQFLPVATLTIYSISFIATAPGGAMLGSGIAFAVGLVLMICSFAALGRSMKDSMRTGSERSLN